MPDVPGSTGDGVEVSLRADTTAPSQARRAFEDAARDLPGDVRGRAELAISEAVANSVRHGSEGEQDEIAISIAVDPDRVLVQVRDAAPMQAPLLPQPPSGIATGRGLGLLLIDRVADRWGATPHEGDGKTVWFELDVPNDAGGPAGRTSH